MPSPPDSDPELVHEARFRLLGSGGRGSRSSIVLGPSLLERSPGGGPWTLAVRDDGTLEPVAAVPSRRMPPISARTPCRRLVFAIAIPSDFQRRRIPSARYLLGGGRQRWRNTWGPPIVRRTIYGWALAYRFPGSTGPALVDPHDDVPDLPAFYESPVELADRIAHLEARGIETRPVAVPVHPLDFVHDPRGGRINRYFPEHVR